MTKNLNIEKLSSDDLEYFEDLIRVFKDVFEMEEFSMPRREYLHKLLTKEGFHAFAALKEGAVIGGLTVYTLDQYYSEKPLAYIFDVAISSKWKRKSIGQALIKQTKCYFQENGYEALFVQAEKVDGHALDFYRKTGPSKEDDVLHFSYLL